MENEGNERLSELYAKTGQWQKAYESYKKYSGSKDSLFNADKSKQMANWKQSLRNDKQLTLQRAEAEKTKPFQRLKKKTANYSTFSCDYRRLLNSLNSLT